MLPRWDKTICVVVTVGVCYKCAFRRWAGKVCNLWKRIHQSTAMFQTCSFLPSLTSALLLDCPRQCWLLYNYFAPLFITTVHSFILVHSLDNFGLLNTLYSVFLLYNIAIALQNTVCSYCTSNTLYKYNDMKITLQFISQNHLKLVRMTLFFTLSLLPSFSPLFSLDLLGCCVKSQTQWKCHC